MITNDNNNINDGDKKQKINNPAVFYLMNKNKYDGTNTIPIKDISGLKNNNNNKSVWDKTSQTLQSVHYDVNDLGMSLEEYNKYTKYDAIPTPYKTIKELNRTRAKNQSVLEQSIKGIGQAVGNEFIIGTLLTVTDVVDKAINLFTKEGENNYINPVSEYLYNLDNDLRNKLEIYTKDPEKAFAFDDFGWISNGLVSVASSASMMIPSIGFVKGAKSLRNLTLGANKYKVANGITKSLAKAGAARPKTLLNTIENFTEVGATAYISRIGENYREARDVYEQSYNETLNKISNLDVEGRKKILKNNPQFEGKTDEEIASYIAGVSADETYKQDMNLFVLDLLQYKGISSLWKHSNRYAKNNKFVKLNKTALQKLNNKKIEDAIDNKNILSKLKDNIKYNIQHPLTSIAALELSEGFEEGFQAINTEKGLEKGRIVLNPNYNTRDLQSYLLDNAIWEQAFWGAIGGIGFQKLGKGFGTIAKKIKDKNNKKNLTEEEYALTKLTDEKIAENEINSRIALSENFKRSITLLNQGENPYEYEIDEVTKQPKNKENEDDNKLTKEQQELLKEKLINDYITDLTLNSVSSGTYDLLKEFIANKEFDKFFEEAGVNSETTDKLFSQYVNEKTDIIREEYLKSLNDIFENIEIDNPKVAEALSRLNVRKKLYSKDLQDRITDIDNEIINNSDDLELTRTYEDYYKNKYIQEQLKELNELEIKLNDDLKNNKISKEAAKQYKKEYNNRRLQLLNSSTGSEQLINDLKKFNNSKNDKSISDFIKEFNEFINDLYKIPIEEPKDNVTKLIINKIKLQDEIDYTNSTLPKTQTQYQEEYDSLKLSIDKYTIDKYNEAADKISKWLEEQEDINDALNKIINNNVPKELQNFVSMLKIGHHSTAKFVESINAVAKEIFDRRAKEKIDNESIKEDNEYVSEKEESIIEEKINDIEDRLNKKEKQTINEQFINKQNEKQNEKPIITNETTSDKETQDIIDEHPEIESYDNPIEKDEIVEDEYGNIIGVKNPNNKKEIIAVAPDIFTSFELSDKEKSQLEGLEKDAEKLNAFYKEDYDINIDDRAAVISQNIIFDLFNTSRNLFDNLLDKNIESEDFKILYDIIFNELLEKGVSKNVIHEAIIRALSTSLNIIYRRVKSNNLSNAEKFKILADEVSSKRTIIRNEDGTFANTSLINETELDNKIDEFIKSYINYRGIVKTKGNKVIINLNDLFKTILKNKDITYEQSKYIFLNIKDYINNYKFLKDREYIFTNKKDFNKYINSPGEFFEKLKTNKSTKEHIDYYLHIPTPTIKSDEHKQAVKKAVDGAPIAISYTISSGGYNNNSISIKQGDIEIGYLGSVEVNETNTAFKLKVQNTGFLYEISIKDGIINSNFDELFVPLIKQETEEFTSLFNLVYKQSVYREAIKNKIITDSIDLNDAKIVLNNSIIKKLIYNNSIKFPKNVTSDLGKAIYILNKLSNIIFYDNNAVTKNELLDSYSTWKDNMYYNYKNTYKIQKKLNEGKPFITKLVGIKSREVIINDKLKNVNELPFNKDKHPIVIVDKDGNIVTESSDKPYINTAGFKVGSMGFLIQDNPNAPIIALFHDANYISDDKDLSNDLRLELKTLFTKYNNKELSFIELYNKLSDLFSSPNSNKNTLFRGISVIKYKDKIVLDIYNHKTENKSSIIIYKDNDNLQNSNINKEFNVKILDKTIDNIINSLKFNRTFYTIENKRESNEKSNKYFYKENGKLIVHIGENKRTYNNFGDFVIKHNAFKTFNSINEDGDFFDTKDDINSLYLDVSYLKPPVEEELGLEQPKSISELFNNADKTNSIEVNDLLNNTSLEKEVINLLSGKNEAELNLLPTEVYLDKYATKSLAYHKDGKIYFTKIGVKETSKSQNNLLRVLLHENLHKRFEELSLFKKDNIVNELLETYDRFIEHINNDLKTLDKNSKEYKIAENIKKWLDNNKFNIDEYFNNLSANAKRIWETKSINEKRRKFAEEWLVESLTQSPIINYLNSKQFNGNESIVVDSIDNENKTIWQKIIDILLKLFGKDVKSIKNNTILAKQYEILGNRNNGKFIDSVSDEKIEKQNEIVKEEIIEEKEIKEEVIEENIESVEETSEKQNLLKELQEEINEDFDLIDFANTNIIETIEEINIENIEQGNKVNNNGVEVVENMNDFANRFSIKYRAKIASMIENSEIKFACK